MTWKGALALMTVVASASAEPTLRGTVLDARGAPVAGARVSVLRLEARWRGIPGTALPLAASLAQAATGEDGTFAIDCAAVPHGLHALAVGEPGGLTLLRHRERIAFGASALPGRLELRMPPGIRVSGIVLDEAGASVAAARVSGVAETDFATAQVEAVTDPAGRFTLTAPADSSLSLTCSTPDHWGVVRAPLASRDGARIALHLEPLGVAEGRVVARDGGRPLAGIRVQALAPTWDVAAPTPDEAEWRPWGSAAVLAESTTTDDGTYRVRVPATGIVFLTSRTTQAAGGRSGPTPLTPGMPTKGIVVDDAGGGVAGVDVRWTEIADGAISDGTGRFELLPDVHAVMVATAPEGATARATIESLGTQARLALPATKLVAGVVRDAGGQPVAGALVRASVELFDVLTATGADGRFALRLRGARRVVASQGSNRAQATPGDALDLRLAPGAEPRTGRAAGTTLRVRVVDEAGRPLEGALVRAADPVAMERGRLIATAASDATGLALLDTEARDGLTVVASRPGRASAATYGARAGSEITMRLVPGATLRGTLRDESGKPVATAAVVAEREVDSSSVDAMRQGVERRAASPDASGTYVLRDLPAGTHAVDVVASGMAPPARQRATLAAGRTTTLDFTILAGSTLQGFVHDEAGPVAGAVVRAYPKDASILGDGFASQRAMRGAYTSEDGIFAIDGLDAETWYDVQVTADWHAEATAGGRPAESVVDVSLDPVGRIEGEVPGILEGSVHCSGLGKRQEDHRRRAFAGIADGEFVMESVPPGAYACKASGGIAEGTLDRVEVKAGIATRVTIAARDRPSIAVEVRDATDRHPIAGATVRLAGADARTDEDGRARVALPAKATSDEAEREGSGAPSPEEDAYRAQFEREVNVSATGYADGEVELASPPRASIVVLLRPLARVSGRTVDASGSPVAGAHVSWEYDVEPTESGADGRFELARPEALVLGEGSESSEGMQVTQTIVASRRREAEILEGRVEIGADAAREVIVVMGPVETAELAVDVRDAAGPVVGAQVSVLIDEDPRMGVTSAQGRFVASSLRPGEAMVIVAAGGVTRQERGVEVIAGARAQVTIVMDDGWYVDGMVLSAGRPIEGVEVTWTGESSGSFGASAISRTDGSFRLGPVPVEDEAVRVLAGRRFGRGVVVRRGDPPVRLDVATVRITGRVVADGVPVPGVTISLRCGDRGVGGSATTEDDGRFAIDDVPASASCELTLRDRERPATSVAVVTASEGAQELGDVAWSERLLRGVATFPAGHAARSLGIEILTSGGSRIGHEDVSLAPDGSFTLRAGSGDLRIVADSDDPELVTVDVAVSDAVVVSLPFELGATLDLRMTDEDGAPVEGFVHVSPADLVAAWDPRSVSAEAEGGTVRIAGLPPGHAELQIICEGGRATFSVDLASGQATIASVVVR